MAIVFSEISMRYAIKSRNKFVRPEIILFICVPPQADFTEILAVTIMEL